VPAPHPPEFRARAVELARLRERRSVREIAQSLGISESCLRNWMAQADVDAGVHVVGLRSVSASGRATRVMGSIGDCFDNALAESFFSSMQVELLDRQRWATRQELANAIFEWIEAFYNPVRRHSGLDYLSPVDYERAHTPAASAA
jgi:hypothetical protein